MMRERELDVDHTTVFRWVQRYAPEINKRIRPHLKMSGASYRADETYIKVGKTCKYLSRAVDEEGHTIEFMLSAKRGVSTAKFRPKEYARRKMVRREVFVKVLEELRARNNFQHAAAWPPLFIALAESHTTAQVSLI